MRTHSVRIKRQLTPWGHKHFTRRGSEFPVLPSPQIDATDGGFLFGRWKSPVVRFKHRAGNLGSTDEKTGILIWGRLPRLPVCSCCVGFCTRLSASPCVGPLLKGLPRHKHVRVRGRVKHHLPKFGDAFISWRENIPRELGWVSEQVLWLWGEGNGCDFFTRREKGGDDASTVLTMAYFEIEDVLALQFAHAFTPRS